MEDGPGAKRPRRRPAAVIIAALVVTLVSAVLGAIAVGRLDGGPRSGPGQNAVPLAPATRLPSTTAGTPDTVSPSAPAATPAPPPTTEFRFQPLWPFRSVAEAAAWQRSYRESGGQPWHLDAEETALNFTRGFLGFTEIDRVVSRSARGDDAYIGVGYQAEGRSSVAAVIHLAKIGRGSDAPWEVVGTADTSLTVERPRYAARVTSPITVGGRISGVDESIRVQIRQPSSEEPIGTYCCRPGGGEKQSWSAQVTFRGAVDPALTVVASTGGHVREIEQFAITGVRRG
ncbi:hypothetical protein EV137_0171 [Kribbella pratensis]|uniref:Uncharacterized protein n=1 Tax=Kribbella pratensis TaxID=2512112 RepID=A0ABY2FJ06_9ACTN|nr:hypothetical protein [Kribbella pratensis]TDW92903.1 hypothetical protein EV137_0171 [Kribbella pratensis]